MAFAAQWHTPHNRCVRFAPAVAGDHATLATGRPLRLTRTGLSPAGTRQLCLAHKQSILPLRGEMDCFASLAMTLNTRPRPRDAKRPRPCMKSLARYPSAPSPTPWNTGSPAFAGDDGWACGGAFAFNESPPAPVIARSEATKQSMPQQKKMDCFAEPVIGRAFARGLYVFALALWVLGRYITSGRVGGR